MFNGLLIDAARPVRGRGVFACALLLTGGLAAGPAWGQGFGGQAPAGPDNNPLAQEQDDDAVPTPQVDLGQEGTFARSQQRETPQVDPRVAQLWADFAHYVLTARADLAGRAAEGLLADDVDAGQLLDAVEQSRYAPQTQQVFDIATELDGLAEQGESVADKLESARLARAQDRERIVQQVQRLTQGRRAYRNAVQRLRAAGQYAAPVLLETLRDDQQARLHPYVTRAMVDVGQPLVYPLSEALPSLSGDTLLQVAQVLGQIGYPDALPAIQALLEDEATGAGTREVLQAAYNGLITQVSASRNASAAELYYLFGELAYSAGTENRPISGLIPGGSQGLIWQYDDAAGLVAAPVPAAVYPDARAAQYARHGLNLDPQLDPALSLFVAADLRRENNLPDGQADAVRAAQGSPTAIAMVAGPQRLKEVLQRALDTGDPALALDAIEALGATAGPAVLTNDSGVRTPLLEALQQSNRRVRYATAVVLAEARPTQSFSGSERVVPTLGEAVRSDSVQRVLVIGEQLDDLAAAIQDQGYEVHRAASIPDASSRVRELPGVDLIVTNYDVPGVRVLMAQSSADYRLTNVPVLALTDTAGEVRLTNEFARLGRLTASTQTPGSDGFAQAMQQAQATMQTGALSEDESASLAERALAQLRRVALGDSVYNAVDAQPALINALGDERPAVASGAGHVLALMPGEEAQQAIADAAVDAFGQVQVALLESLAESATIHGNLIDDQAADSVLELVRSDDPTVADAAARAHGALTLPTAHAVQLIGGGSE
jgi:CheY-like chemotaxis protein